MLKAVVEIIPIQPSETAVVIVPLFEQLIEIPGSLTDMPHTLAHALYLYVEGESGHLLSILEKDETTCDFVTQFEETWFVRAELDSGLCSSGLRETGEAVHLARVIQSRRMALLALD